MSEKERRYAKIEKEAIAMTWVCEKFTDYILGQKFWIRVRPQAIDTTSEQ